MAKNFINLPKRYLFHAFLLYSCITFSQSGRILKIDSISQAGVVGKVVTAYRDEYYALMGTYYEELGGQQIEFLLH